MTFCTARNYCKPSRGLAAVPGHGRKVEWRCLLCRGTVPLPEGLPGVPVPLLAPPWLGWGSGLGSGPGGCAGCWLGSACPEAPACSRRSSLDSCNVSVACLSFHGVSILQPPSVLIPGGRGAGVFTLAPRVRCRDPSRAGHAPYFTCSNSSSNICWLIKGTFAVNCFSLPRWEMSRGRHTCEHGFLADRGEPSC